MMMRSLLWMAGLLILQACTTPTAGQRAAQAASYQGRISLRVDAIPAQSLNADFLITGSATTGTLQLSGPLGATLAQLQWAPGFAELHQQGRIESYPDLPSLLAQLTGSALPTDVVFGWLEGKGLAGLAQTGWSLLEEGDTNPRRLRLVRQTPAPAVRLTLLLDETP